MAAPAEIAPAKKVMISIGRIGNGPPSYDILLIDEPLSNIAIIWTNVNTPKNTNGKDTHRSTFDTDSFMTKKLFR
jgi:hypothetical protein